MTAAELQQYVDEHIPIVKANGFTILEARPDRVSVGGTLADHVNHRNSAFGGSLSTALILAAWARVRQWTDTFDPSAVIVIAEQRVAFGLPVLADFEAYSLPLADDLLARAWTMLGRFGKARFTVEAAVVHRGDTEMRARFSGVFVVVSGGP
jgi:thioesterase domain-containing protein